MRDLAEDTNNHTEAILVYELLGKMYQSRKQYPLALLAFKKMLQLAWCDLDKKAELKAYEYLALQHFYMEDINRA